MDPAFWHGLWQQGDIKFHEAEVNPALIRHLPALGLVSGARIFVPLCGKTRDIAWLLSQGFQVAGAELSQIAVQQLFDALGVVPEVTQTGNLHRYSADGIDIYVGDIFALNGAQLGTIDASYDRAALVALPAEMRLRYGAHMHDITGGAPQVVVCFEYDQTLMDGPPFRVDGEEVARVYASLYSCEVLASRPLRDGLKGQPAIQTVWHLS